jgi:hypothetical protein
VATRWVTRPIFSPCRFRPSLPFAAHTTRPEIAGGTTNRSRSPFALLTARWPWGEGPLPRRKHRSVIISAACLQRVTRQPGERLRTRHIQVAWSAILQRQPGRSRKRGEATQMAQMLLDRAAYPGKRRLLGARRSGDGKPLRPRKVLIDPIENRSKLFRLASLQDVRSPKRECGPDHTAAMTVGRMSVVPHESDGSPSGML